MYRGKSKKKKFCLKRWKIKFQSALLDPPGWYTGNNFLFEGGLSWHLCYVYGMNRVLSKGKTILDNSEIIKYFLTNLILVYLDSNWDGDHHEATLRWIIVSCLPGRKRNGWNSAGYGGLEYAGASRLLSYRSLCVQDVGVFQAFRNELTIYQPWNTRDFRFSL